MEYQILVRDSKGKDVVNITVPENCLILVSKLEKDENGWTRQIMNWKKKSRLLEQSTL